jgi:hypothetical protein
MEAKEKLERFSKEVILVAAAAAEACASGEEGAEMGAFIVVLSQERLSPIRSGF